MMSIKSLVVVLCVIFSSGLCGIAKYSIDPTPYNKQALSWVQQHICDTHGQLLVPSHDLQALANTLYFSYYRSKITLDAQDASLKALATLWNNYENITTTRRNPSKATPHELDTIKQREDIESSIQLSVLHHSIGKTYAHITEAGVKGSLLHAAHAVRALDSIRHDSRVVVAQAILDVRALLGQLYYTAQERTRSLDETIHKEKVYTRTVIRLMDFIWSYVPQLAIKSFVNADNFNNRVSTEVWQTFMSIQDVSLKTWLAIEEARAAFYQAHYQAIYTIMQEQQISPEYYTIIANEHGLIEQHNQILILPSPELLP